MARFPYLLADQLCAGDTVYTVWSTIAETGLVDHIASTDFKTITLDMQHGGHHEQSINDGVAAIVNRGKSAVVRIPLGRNDMASRALDMGADAVIAPMINSAEDARQFAAAMKYPPLGERSWGAFRAMSVRGVEGGTPFLQSANSNTLAIAMIETKQALAALDDILAVEGIDGVFVGPADFSITWSGGETVDPTLGEMNSAIEDIAKRAKAMGKLSGIFSFNPANAARYASMGYQFIAIGFDTGLIDSGAKASLDAASASS